MAYLVTSEVFPTVVRSTSFGFSTIPSRVFMVFYSYVMYIGGDRLPWVSPLIMGTLGLVAAFVSLALPDTRQVMLLETIEETEAFYRKEQTVLAKLFAQFRKSKVMPTPLDSTVDTKAVADGTVSP